MRGKEHFTANRVAKFSCPTGKQQDIYWDGKTPGLGLRVTSSGAKSYIFETRLHGKTVRLTIGDIRSWSIGQAQAKATEYKRLTDQGIDPRQQMAEQRATVEATRKNTARQSMTVQDAWNAYIANRSHKWSARHLADHKALTHGGGVAKKRGAGVTKAGALAELMPLNLSNMNTDRVRAWLNEEARQRPTQARLAYNRLRAFLNWCADSPAYRGIASPDACKASIAKDTLPKTKAKSDALQREQLATWFCAVKGIGNPVIAAYLQVLMLTGARREEIASLRWTEVDFKWQTLVIRDKVEGERTIPLTPYVATLLADLKRRNDTPPPRYRILHGKTIENDLQNWKPPEWVFTSKTAKATAGRLTEPRIAHTRALSAAGLPHVSLHGLRRSFGTLAEWVECPTGIAAQIMGHKPSATAEKHYRVRPIDLLRMWHTKIETWILEQAKIQFVPSKAGLREVA